MSPAFLNRTGKSKHCFNDIFCRTVHLSKRQANHPPRGLFFFLLIFCLASTNCLRQTPIAVLAVQICFRPGWPFGCCRPDVCVCVCVCGCFFWSFEPYLWVAVNRKPQGNQSVWRPQAEGDPFLGQLHGAGSISPLGRQNFPQKRLPRTPPKLGFHFP